MKREELGTTNCASPAAFLSVFWAILFLKVSVSDPSQTSDKETEQQRMSKSHSMNEE